MFLLAILIGSGFVLRLLAGMTFDHRFDLNFYIAWSSGVQEGIFSAYEHIPSLDYPPLILLPMLLVGKAMKAGAQDNAMLMMLALKFFQMFFDALTALLFYFCFRKRQEELGLILAAVWVLNPAMVVNSAYWGQTDSMMLFFLLAAFACLEGDAPVWAGVLMALACLTKLQSVYFTPLFLLAVVMRHGPGKAVSSLAAALGTGALVFAPFMLVSGVTLPLRVYFGGFGKYGYASLNAMNLYALLGLNFEPDTLPLVGGLTLSQLNPVFLAVSIGAVLILYQRAPEKNVWLPLYLQMQLLFLFTPRMHERYQVPVLLFLLAAYAALGDLRLLGLYALQSALVTANELAVLLKVTRPDSVPFLVQHSSALMAVGGALNLTLFFFGGAYVLMHMWQPVPRRYSVLREPAR